MNPESAPDAMVDAAELAAIARSDKVADHLCQCPECGRSHRHMGFGKPPLKWTAKVWEPGLSVEGVQELAYDPGDGSTISSRRGMLGAERVDPGDVIVDTGMSLHVIKAADFITPPNF